MIDVQLFIFANKLQVQNLTPTPGITRSWLELLSKEADWLAEQVFVGCFELERSSLIQECRRLVWRHGDSWQQDKKVKQTLPNRGLWDRLGFAGTN